MKSSTPRPPTLSAAENLALSMRIYDQAIAEGTHSAKSLHACGGNCGRWVESIYHVDPATKRRLCPDCANAAGVGPRQFDERIAKAKGRAA